MIDRLSVLKTILWALVGVLGAITVVRLFYGLGAVTNLSDAAPWGLWNGFDVMARIALAAGAFTLAATVYIFHLEAYHPFARPAILTALLAYLTADVCLLFDLGLPWNIWHPMVYWQHYSVLFEVAICVMLYLTVLSLEFAPVVLEHPSFTRPLYRITYKLIKKATIPLVIAGIVISTLHQSSLGSLFLITPYRLHPLWYSPIIYVLFFVSAIAFGLMTVVMESLFVGYFLKYKVPVQQLSRLSVAAAWLLGVYAIVRVGDLAVQKQLGVCLDGSWLSWLFLFEMAVSVLIPAGLLIFPKVRSSIAGLAVCSGLTVFGMTLYRMDVCIIAFARPEGMSYFPSWMELTISVGIIAGAILAFLYFVENFKVYEHLQPELLTTKPSYDPSTLHRLLPEELARGRRYSLAAISAAALTVLALPVEGAKPVKTSVLAPRTVDGFALARKDVKGRTLALSQPKEASSGVESVRLLLIDGNHRSDSVLFNHVAHVERAGGEQACAVCHHLNMPLDRSSSCSACHRDMYEQTSVFRHDQHVAAFDGNRGCTQCHADSTEAKTYLTAKACTECHEQPQASDSVIPEAHPRWLPATGYMNALHDLCIKCHEKKVKEAPAQYSPTLARCDTCHDTNRSSELSLLAPGASKNNGPKTNP